MDYRPYRRKTIQQHTKCIPADICTVRIARYLTLSMGITIRVAMDVSHCMVCKSVREDNPRALAS